jgi:hypothetical protein
VHHCLARVVDKVSGRVLHAELNAVHSVVNSEPGIDDTFNGSNTFLVLVLERAVVPRADGHEDLAEHLVLTDHILHRHAELNVRKELQLIEGCFKLVLGILIEQIGVLGVVS